MGANRPEYMRAYYLAHKEQIAARQRAYVAANPEKIKKSAKRWKDRNRERIRELQRKSYLANKEKVLANAARWRKNNPERVRELAVRNRLAKRYGMSIDQWKQMIRDQHGKCPICNGDLALLKNAVDHDHATGRVRAILCKRCNMALGMFSESPLILRSAAEYLEHHANVVNPISDTISLADSQTPMQGEIATVPGVTN